MGQLSEDDECRSSLVSFSGLGVEGEIYTGQSELDYFFNAILKLSLLSLGWKDLRKHKYLFVKTQVQFVRH